MRFYDLIGELLYLESRVFFQLGVIFFQTIDNILKSEKDARLIVINSRDSRESLFDRVK